MAHNMERRLFLRGQVARRNFVLRPPWALQEAAFVEQCIRCNECVDACPENILMRGSGGFPQVNHHLGECTFCGDCVSACKTRALNSDDFAPERAWPASAQVGEACLSIKGITCRTCGDTCDMRAIRFQLLTGGRASVTIDTTLCNACGACVAPCPVNAISISSASKAEQQQLEDCA